MAFSIQEIPLPFDDLIAELKRRQFNVGVEQHLRLFRLLEKLESKCSPEQLKTLLCPIFATDEKQQAEFYKIFDSQYALFQPPTPQPAEESKEVDKCKRGNKSKQVLVKKTGRRTSYLLWLTGFLALTCAAIILLIYSSGVHPSAGFSPPQLSGELRPQTTLLSPTLTQQPSLGPHSFADFVLKYRSALRLAALLIPLIVFTLCETIRYWTRKPVLESERAPGPPFTWRFDIKVRPLQDYSSGRLSSIARKLRRREISDVKRLDIALTIAATIEAQGYPSFQFRPESRFPEYLVLIERVLPRDHQAALFDQLASALERENVFVDRFLFEGDPSICWCPSDSVRLSLGELQRKFPEHKLLIFSGAETFLDPVSSNLASWTPALFNWRERAVLTPAEPSRWGFAERRVAKQFIVLPASVEGLDKLAEAFNAGLMPDYFGSLSPHRASKSQGDSLSQIPELRQHLGESAFEWLCACAVYPELHWELTMFLGSLPELGPSLLAERNFLRLFQLPFFRTGTIPNKIRLSLIESLDEEKEQATRRAIVGLFSRSSMPERRSYAYEDWNFKFVSQNALLHRKQAERLKSKLQELRREDIEGDYVVFHLLEKIPASRLSLILPRALRIIFFEKGLSLLGLTTTARAVLTLAVIGIAWWSVDNFSAAPASPPSAQSLSAGSSRTTTSVSALTPTSARPAITPQSKSTPEQATATGQNQLGDSRRVLDEAQQINEAILKQAPTQLSSDVTPAKTEATSSPGHP